jgi:AcrR family transcriptional regulator
MKTIDLIKEEQTKKEIISASRQLFQRYGIDKTTMDDIAREVGKGKSTLYYYYTSKEEIFYAVVSKEKDEVIASIKNTIQNIKLPSEQLKLFFLTHFNELRKKLNLYSVIFQGNGEKHMENVKKHMDLFYKIQKETLNSQVDMLKKILLNGMKIGEFKSIVEKDCESIATVAVMMIQGLDSNLIFSKNNMKKTLRIETAIDIFIKGLKYGR